MVAEGGEVNNLYETMINKGECLYTATCMYADKTKTMTPTSTTTSSTTVNATNANPGTHTHNDTDCFVKDEFFQLIQSMFQSTQCLAMLWRTPQQALSHSHS